MASRCRGENARVVVVCQVQLQIGRPVTESKLVLLTVQQAGASRDEVLGQGITTLFRKPADRENGALVSQRTNLPELRLSLLKGEGVWLVVANFLLPESFVLVAGH